MSTIKTDPWVLMVMNQVNNVQQRLDKDVFELERLWKRTNIGRIEQVK